MLHRLYVVRVSNMYDIIMCGLMYVTICDSIVHDVCVVLAVCIAVCGNIVCVCCSMCLYVCVCGGAY